MAGFTGLTDLASRRIGGSVVWANDELFAERENLIQPHPPVFSPDTFGPKGKIYDGWETRRRREPGHDEAIVRLGAAGIVHGVVVDTAFFRGNYPQQISIEATSAEGYPSPAELRAAEWVRLVERTDACGDTANAYRVADRRRFTHVRLSIYPDGGVARLRVHGEVLPDPRLLHGTIDLAALEHGGTMVDCSDAFYSAPVNLIAPGQARIMADGWENARRRGGGNDHATFRLAAAGEPARIEVDTTCFVGNAPGWVKVTAADERRDDLGDPAGWWEALPRTRVQPDTRHQFLVPATRAVTHVRLDVYPDGGLARLRVPGTLTPDAHAALARRWWTALPAPHRAAIGAPPPEAG